MTTLSQEYFSIREIAELVHVTPACVRRWCDTGKLGSVRIGGSIRIPQEELTIFIRANKATA
jgi:excisionase family DNA binding protein